MEARIHGRVKYLVEDTGVSTILVKKVIRSSTNDEIGKKKNVEKQTVEDTLGDDKYSLRVT